MSEDPEQLLHRRGVRTLFVDRLCQAGDVGDHVWSLIMEAIVASALGVMPVPRPGHADGVRNPAGPWITVAVPVSRVSVLLAPAPAGCLGPFRGASGR